MWTCECVTLCFLRSASPAAQVTLRPRPAMPLAPLSPMSFLPLPTPANPVTVPTTWLCVCQPHTPPPPWISCCLTCSCSSVCMCVWRHIMCLWRVCVCVWWWIQCSVGETYYCYFLNIYIVWVSLSLVNCSWHRFLLQSLISAVSDGTEMITTQRRVCFFTV